LVLFGGTFFSGEGRLKTKIYFDVKGRRGRFVFGVKRTSFLFQEKIRNKVEGFWGDNKKFVGLMNRKEKELNSL
jgi:hypothetical protein